MARPSDMWDSAPYPQNLIDAVFNVKTDEPDPDEVFTEVVHRCGMWADIACAMRAARLSEREGQVIEMRFVQGKTLKETGAALGIQSERTRQIEAKALRKLRYGNAQKILRVGMDRYIADWIEQIRKTEAAKADSAIAEFQRYWIEEHPDGHEGTPEDIARIDRQTWGMSMTVEELELSVRAYNCMKRASLNNVAEMVHLAHEKGMDGFMGIRNLGRKSAEEVIQRVRDRTGIDLEKECEMCRAVEMPEVTNRP